MLIPTCQGGSPKKVENVGIVSVLEYMPHGLYNLQERERSVKESTSPFRAETDRQKGRERNFLHPTFSSSSPALLFLLSLNERAGKKVP